MAILANLVIDQGTDYNTTINVEGNNGLPYDLTGFTARGQARRTYNSVSAYNFQFTINRPTDGEIDMYAPASITSTMKPGRYVYDVEIVETGTGDVTRVVEGQIEITPRVTR